MTYRNASRDNYTSKALAQLPRLLTCLDRNPFSPTYGCFHRDYWLYKTSDFPDAIRQFGMLSLALVYNHDFPGNPYFKNTMVKEWAVASMMYCTTIQHRDGTFDEFYPYERGWVGPTAFVAYALAESYALLKHTMDPALHAPVLACIRKAALSISRGDQEKDLLANHHAMACLALWKANKLLREEWLSKAYQRQWKNFLQYHHFSEGWSVEYDGPDAGYLSATISFLARIYKEDPTVEMYEVLARSVDFAAHFAYPDGSFAGMTGSRNTQHFYPAGFEILGQEYLPATAVAEKMLAALGEGKLVSPEIMSDRYVFYRVPELLHAWIEYASVQESLPMLPYEQPEYFRFFEKAGIYVHTTLSHYFIASLAKGGVCRVFNLRSGLPLFNDGGIVLTLKQGRVLTSQWMDTSARTEAAWNSWKVSGSLNSIPMHRNFNPARFILFRIFLSGISLSPRISHWLKGIIRSVLIHSHGKVAVAYERTFRIQGSNLYITDEIRLNRKASFRSLRIGGHFYTRYVPQSRFFQFYELNDQAWNAGPDELIELQRAGILKTERMINLS